MRDEINESTINTELEKVNHDNVSRILSGIGTTFNREEVPFFDGVVAMMTSIALAANSRLYTPTEEERDAMIDSLAELFKDVLDRYMEINEH